MKTLTYRSPVNHETITLHPLDDGSFGIEPGADVTDDDLSTARVTVACLALAVPLWVVAAWLLT